MADATNELMLSILRQMQEMQGAQTRLLDEHTQGFVRMERRLDEMHETMVTALGLAGHANIRHDTVHDRLEDLARRVDKLERAR